MHTPAGIAYSRRRPSNEMSGVAAAPMGQATAPCASLNQSFCHLSDPDAACSVTGTATSYCAANIGRPKDWVPGSW